MLELLEHLKVHNLNYELIFNYFLDSDFDVEPATLFGDDALSVSFEAGSKIVTIVHRCVPEITKLPQFFLVDSNRFGRLAHILPVPEKDNIGAICVNEQDSVSINFERPELVFEESIKRHIDLLTSIIGNSKFNDDELLREFNTNWELNNQSLLGNNIRTLYCEPKKDVLELFQIYKPIQNSPFMNLPSSWVAITENDDQLNANLFFDKEKRHIQKEAMACVLPLQSVETDLPSNLELLKSSYMNDGNNGTDDTSPTFKAFEEGSKTMSKEANTQLAIRQEKFIRDLKNALLRIENKTYGVCRVTYKLINKERLKLVPHATLSIEAKNMQK